MVEVVGHLPLALVLEIQVDAPFVSIERKKREVLVTLDGVQLERSDCEPLGVAAYSLASRWLDLYDVRVEFAQDLSGERALRELCKTDDANVR